MDPVRSQPRRRRRKAHHAPSRLAGRSSSDPIRRRPCADPGQKRDTGDGIRLKRTKRYRAARLIVRLDSMVALCDAALKDAGCRLRRWPTAVPDRGVTQRPHEPQAGPRKRQPGRTRKLARKAKMKTSRSKGIDKRRPVTEDADMDLGVSNPHILFYGNCSQILSV